MNAQRESNESEGIDGIHFLDSLGAKIKMSKEAARVHCQPFAST